jgi:hypothetical protein
VLPAGSRLYGWCGDGVEISTGPSVRAPCEWSGQLKVAAPGGLGLRVVWLGLGVVEFFHPVAAFQDFAWAGAVWRADYAIFFH